MLDEGGGDHLRAIVAAPAVRGAEADRPAPAGPQRGPRAVRRTARSTRSRSRPRCSDRADRTRYPESMAADPALKQQVEQAIADNPVLLFMKGTPETPRCGFSMRVVGVLEQLGVEYGAIDVLPALQPLREVTTELSDWQTFPQLYVERRAGRRLPTSSRRCSTPASSASCSASSSRPRSTPPEPRAHPARRLADEPADAARLSPLDRAQPSTRSAASSQRAISSASRARARSWRAVDRAERSGSDQCDGSASSSSSRLNAASASSTSRSSRASSALRFLLGPAAWRACRFGARAPAARRALGLGRRPVLGPAARVAAQPPVLDHERARADRLEQRPVVGDQQHRAREAGERVLERLAALEVEVVGGLVEDQQVGVGAGQQREREALRLAAGESREALADVVAARTGSGRAGPGSSPPRARSRAGRGRARSPRRRRRARCAGRGSRA